MPLSAYSDPTVFALALSQAPQLRGIRHPGHINVLVSWMRAGGGIGGCPAWPTLQESVYAPYREFLAVADLRQIPARWREVGWSAGSLLASRLDIDAPGALLSQIGKTAGPNYDELPGAADFLGLLALPVSHIAHGRRHSLLSVFILGL
ncbi:hypothetical protein [Nitrospirillum viridazoti]|uniref:Uncharacterized protein n=1 Tax=Nitrospirillum amazonense TaxID=28077 RepID=A0A560IC48_9PROT|nr:hypothetical protein [Nitrospirillum amazonense]TWB56622.1 hypothetical protein FBZ92_11042 [Nitrospirillum amazonense]